MPEPDLFEYAIGENLRKLAAERGALVDDARRRLADIEHSRRLWVWVSLVAITVLLGALVVVTVHG